MNSVVSYISIKMLKMNRRAGLGMEGWNRMPVTPQKGLSASGDLLQSWSDKDVGEGCMLEVEK